MKFILCAFYIKFMSSKNNQEKLQKRWNKSNILFEEYGRHLRSVKNLSFYELLLVKNFKWWSAVFSESIEDIEKKLEHYFKKIQEYKSKELTEEQLIKDLFCLIENPKTKIKWFAYSFLSAMLAMFFPETFPVMDWRVLSAKWIIKYDKVANIYFFEWSKSKK